SLLAGPDDDSAVEAAGPEVQRRALGSGREGELERERAAGPAARVRRDGHGARSRKPAVAVEAGGEEREPGRSIGAPALEARAAVVASGPRHERHGRAPRLIAPPQVAREMPRADVRGVARVE